MTDISLFEKMLSEENWPVRKGDYFLLEGDVWQFVSDNPFEECIRPALHTGQFQ